MTTKTKKQEGFTIIEVMLVLAIAGLIMLIVFLAVPALQRNSRNTQRKNDVAAVLNGVNEWMSNNAGKQVTSANLATIKPNVNPGYYSNDTATGQGSITVSDSASVNPLGASSDNDRVVIVPRAKCSETNGAETGPARAVVALYLVETRTSYQPMCQDG